ncbi:MAG: hypothetical protein HDT40_10060 [Lachnospiraceae bacterium]|nr:hypothetical protein [Lachnospiraceae bacterium]
MNFEYNRLSGDAIKEAGKSEISDCFMLENNYFCCGYSRKIFYNHTYAVAIAIIGKIYGSNSGDNSNYHKGISYIAKELGISKRQVKSLRKKYKVHGGYEFKTPYKIPAIVEKIIILLQEQENDEMIQKMVRTYDETLYRTLLIGVQYDEIRTAATALKRKKVLEVEGKLKNLTQNFRG